MCYLAAMLPALDRFSPAGVSVSKMLKISVLLALLLPVAVRSDGSNNDLEYGVKLCGREFIRTVVMSCGGSRWKRYSSEPGQEQLNPYRELLNWLNSDHFFMFPEHLNSLPESEQQSQGPVGPAALLGESPLDDLLGRYNGPVPDAEENSHLQEGSSRTKRSSGSAGSCCRHGCTKSELVRFC